MVETYLCTLIWAGVGVSGHIGTGARALGNPAAIRWRERKLAGMAGG